MLSLILGDSAFPFHTWLMKFDCNAVLTPEHRHFNYCLKAAILIYVKCVQRELHITGNNIILLLKQAHCITFVKKSN